MITRSAAFGIAAAFGYLIGEDIAAQILPVIGKSIHLQLGYQINMLLYTTNINAFYADTLPKALAQGLDKRVKNPRIECGGLEKLLSVLAQAAPSLLD